jgi:hypothetical protein
VFKKLESKSVSSVSFIQALGIFFYISLIAILFQNGERLFGGMPSFLGFILFLTLFSVSALICAIICLSYPFYLAWEKKETKKALSVIFYTTGYLFMFFLIILALIALF